MSPTNYAQLLRLALPKIIVVATALIVMALDLVFLRKRPFNPRPLRRRLLRRIAGLRRRNPPHPARARTANIFDGMLIANPLTHLVQIALLVLTIFALLLSVESTFTEHVGEFVLLILTATVGMMFLVASQDLLVIFISLELLSLSLYTSPRSTSAACNPGKPRSNTFSSAECRPRSCSSGSACSTASPTPPASPYCRRHPRPALNPLLVIAIVTTAIGLGFKVAAAPFHFWAPDVYQGAPAPSAAFIASGIQGRQLLHLLPDRWRSASPARKAPPPCRTCARLGAGARPDRRCCPCCWATSSPFARAACAACLPTPPSPMPATCCSPSWPTPSRASPRCSTTSSPTRSPPWAPSPSSRSSSAKGQRPARPLRRTQPAAPGALRLPRDLHPVA
jgi:hypothetical protein